MKMRPRLLSQGGLVLCLALLIAHAARAHTLPVSELTIVPDESYLHLDLTLNPFELTFFSELDVNRNGKLDLGEWEGQGEKIARRILENVKLRVNGEVVQAAIAGLSQTYESHHIFVRAHFPVDARTARVSIDSRLTELTSGSHMTQVTYGAGDRMQIARLDAQSKQVMFEPFEGSRGVASAATAHGASDFTALQANERAVTALLGLLFLAGLPPTIFFVLSTRFAMDHHPLPHPAVQ